MKQAALKILIAGAFFASATTQAVAAPEGEIRYVVKPSDTLYELTKRYLVNPAALERVRRANGVRNPRLMQVGQTLKIPRSLLKYRPVPLTLQSFSGSVSLTARGRNVTPRVGLSVREGAEITTRANSFAAFSGDGNSRLSIPSNSRVRIIDARRYLINGQIDVQIRVLKGRSEVVAPKVNGQGRYRIGTPLSVTAVRGTEFRVGFEPDGEVSLTEVLEGEVAVSAGESEAATAAGFGVASAKDQLGAQERLLTAPELVDPGRIQTAEMVEFAINELSGAAGYRTQIAKDAGFVEVVTERITDTPLASFDGLEDGRYFVRSRAISASGLEGLSRTFSFRRKRAGVEGGVEPSPFDDAFKFAWRTQGSEDSLSAFQLWNAKTPGQLLVDEVALENSAIIISNLESGDYRWRVATFEIDEGDVIKVWSPTQELSVTE